MIYRLFFLFLSTSLFAQSSSSSVLANAYTAIYAIDPMQRGTDILNMVSTFSSSAYNNPYSPGYIAIQTTNNGLINNVKGIYSRLSNFNYTILIIEYNLSNNTPQYIAVPVEQIVEVMYSTNAIGGAIGGGFSAAITTGVLPVYEVNILERANDLITVFSVLQCVNTPLLKTCGSIGRMYTNSQVALQTTLTGNLGSSYAPISNGFIPNVQSISMTNPSYGTLLLIKYKASNNQIYSLSIGTEQIYQINFTHN